MIGRSLACSSLCSLTFANCLLPNAATQIEVTYPDGSPADGIRVRVKAELTPKDNVYTSELISKDGQASFEIPSIPTAAQYVWLEVSSRAHPGESPKAFGFRRLFLFLVVRPK